MYHPLQNAVAHIPCTMLYTAKLVSVVGDTVGGCKIFVRAEDNVRYSSMESTRLSKASHRSPTPPPPPLHKRQTKPEKTPSQNISHQRHHSAAVKIRMFPFPPHHSIRLLAFFHPSITIRPVSNATQTITSALAGSD